MTLAFMSATVERTMITEENLGQVSSMSPSCSSVSRVILTPLAYLGRVKSQRRINR